MLHAAAAGGGLLLDLAQICVIDQHVLVIVCAVLARAVLV